jgi:hypothetical protein
LFAGTPQHLKSKFGKGGSITASARNKPAAVRFLEHKFPGGECSDDHSNTLTYSISDEVALTELFTVRGLSGPWTRTRTHVLSLLCTCSCSSSNRTRTRTHVVLFVHACSCAGPTHSRSHITSDVLMLTAIRSSPRIVRADRCSPPIAPSHLTLQCSHWRLTFTRASHTDDGVC